MGKQLRSLLVRTKAILLPVYPHASCQGVEGPLNADIDRIFLFLTCCATAHDSWCCCQKRLCCAADFPFSPSIAQTLKYNSQCLIATCPVGNKAKFWTPCCYLENLWFPFLPVNKSSQLKEWDIDCSQDICCIKGRKRAFTEWILKFSVSSRKETVITIYSIIKQIVIVRLKGDDQIYGECLNF